MDESQVICTIQDLKKQQVKQQQQRQILNNLSEKENWTSESEENDDSEEQCQSGTIPSSPVGLVSSPSFTSNSPNSHISFENEALKSQLLSFLKNSSMTDWEENNCIKKFRLFDDAISCVLWHGECYITGTDIVKCVHWRFKLEDILIRDYKKFEEGVFSDLRNLKAGTHAVLEEPRSVFLEFLFRLGCIRTHKKQKVFFWNSVPHEKLFQEALRRERKREMNPYADTLLSLRVSPTPKRARRSLNSSSSSSSSTSHIHKEPQPNHQLQSKIKLNIPNEKKISSNVKTQTKDQKTKHSKQKNCNIQKFPFSSDSEPITSLDPPLKDIHQPPNQFLTQDLPQLPILPSIKVAFADIFDSPLHTQPPTSPSSFNSMNLKNGHQLMMNNDLEIRKEKNELNRPINHEFKSERTSPEIYKQNFLPSKENSIVYPNLCWFSKSEPFSLKAHSNST